MTTLELLEYIAAERAALAHCYPLPSALDCVRYALTELGEYEDAMLRAERTGDKRNNQKPSDARRELGQVGEMLGAAIVQMDRWELLVPDVDVPQFKLRIHGLAEMTERTATSMLSYAEGCIIPFNAGLAFGAWQGLCTWHGWDTHSLLVERYAQVQEKHCQEAA